MNEVTLKLEKLFESWAKEKVSSLFPMAQSGSDRKYYRIRGNNKTAIGVYNPDKQENNAFISFTNHFLKKGLHVPKLYAQRPKKNIYLSSFYCTTEGR